MEYIYYYLFYYLLFTIIVIAVVVVVICLVVIVIIICTTTLSSVRFYYYNYSNYCHPKEVKFIVIIYYLLLLSTYFLCSCLVRLNMASNDIGDWYRNIPLVTKYWFTGSVIFPLLGRFGFVSIATLMLDYESLIYGFQVTLLLQSVLVYTIFSLCVDRSGARLIGWRPVLAKSPLRRKVSAGFHKGGGATHQPPAPW